MPGLIVHEWLGKTGGSERVVDAMVEAFPDAGLLALWNDAPEKYTDVRESWLARTRLRHHKALALPFLPFTWRRVVPPSDSVDWVLVSSHLFAHHVDVRSTSGRHVPKYVYVHTPARYIWAPELDRRGQSVSARVAGALLKPLDRRRAGEADELAANSCFVRERIRRSWDRDARVIYPPVEVDCIEAVSDWREKLTLPESDLVSRLPQGYLLGASRFVPYKRLDDVIRVGAVLGRPVVIAGSGAEEGHLRSVAEEAGVPVEFVISPSNELLLSLYQQSATYVFPAIEDFGIMPVEAIAAGASVVVGPVGGAAESVTMSGSGVVAESDSVRSLADAARHAILLPKRSSHDGDVDALFGKQRFIDQVRGWVRG